MDETLAWEPDPEYESDFESFELHDLISYLVCKFCGVVPSAFSKPARDLDP